MKNLAAFHYGRMAAHDPASLPAVDAESEAMQSDPDRRRYLTAYQNAALADRFERLVDQVRNAETLATAQGMRALRREGGRDALPPEPTPLADAVAESYFTLLTPKDEYEVARLFTDGAFAAKLANQFEPGFRLQYRMAPPILSRRGSRRKLALGPWMSPLLRLLARMRGLRGSLFDPFRFTHDRKLERDLLKLYEEDVTFLLTHLDPDRIAAAIELARWPMNVRGYGFIKAQAAEAALDRRKKLQALVRAIPIGRAA